MHVGSSTSAASQSLSSSSKKLRVTIEPPADGTGFHRPGDTLRGVASCTSDLSSFSSIELQLKCSSTVTVMGKQRWQMAQLAASGTMLAMPITTIEEHVISRSTQQLWPPTGQEAKGKKAEPSGSASFEMGFELELPMEQPACTCRHHPSPLVMPPTCQAIAKVTDNSAINVKYVLSVKGKRTGIFKRGERADIEVQVGSSPSALPAYFEGTESRRNQVAVKYKGAEDSGGLYLEAQLHLDDDRNTYPAGSEIAWTATWTLVANDSSAPPPSDALLASIDPEVNVSFARTPTTVPIDRPSSGEAFSFGPLRVCAATITRPMYTRDNGERAVSGTITVPEDAVSLLTCAASIEYKLHASLVSTSKLDRILALSVPVIVQH